MIDFSEKALMGLKKLSKYDRISAVSKLKDVESNVTLGIPIVIFGEKTTKNLFKIGFSESRYRIIYERHDSCISVLFIQEIPEIYSVLGMLKQLSDEDDKIIADRIHYNNFESPEPLKHMLH